jgi:hypothetical protein
MARASSNLLSTPVRKPISFAVERAFPARVSSGDRVVAAPTPPGPTSAIARVRDSLILRVVARNVSVERNHPDGQRVR